MTGPEQNRRGGRATVGQRRRAKEGSGAPAAASQTPASEAAMRRATMKARRRAIALTGRVVTIRNGKVEYDTEP